LDEWQLRTWRSPFEGSCNDEISTDPDHGFGRDQQIVDRFDGLKSNRCAAIRVTRRALGSKKGGMRAGLVFPNATKMQR
jgi:hypothetical protein